MVKKILFLFPPLFFLIIKLPDISIRISDTNIYFYTAYQILQGKILYKDLFFTNFPGFAYISSLYFLLTSGSPTLFYITSIIETIIISILIYYIVKNKTKNLTISLASQVLYLFSFIVLSTSDHQTGVFTASLFAILSYLFYKKNRLFLSGIFISLTFLTKAYFLPIIIAFFVYSVLDKKLRNTVKISFSFLLTSSLTLLPSILLTKNDFIKDVFLYSLTRSAGIMKGDIFWFFTIHDIILFMLLFFSLLNFKKNLFLAILSTLSLCFLIFYNDIYYLYLNFIIPFLCLSLSEFIYFLKNKFNLQIILIPIFIFIAISVNLFVYLSYYKNIGKINNINSLVNTIKKEKPEFLYGVNDITPVLAYLSSTRLLDNIIDTNENIFRKKILNSKTLTNQAIKHKTIIVSHGAYYQDININERIIDNIFAKDIVSKKCKYLTGTPVIMEGVTNRINLFKCY